MPVCDLSDELRLPGGICDLRGQRQITALLKWRLHPGPITSDLFEVVRKEIPTAGPGQILIKQTHMSLDPAMIGWMSPDPESYIPPVALGEVMRASGLGAVVESNHPDFAVGDTVRGMTGWTEYIVSNGEGFTKVQAGLDAETVLAVFALPG